MHGLRFFRFALPAVALFLPLQMFGASYYLVATTITGQNTKIDVSATTTWSFSVSQSFDLGGGSLVMKDTAQTGDSLFLTLYDLTDGSLTPNSPGTSTNCTDPAGLNSPSQLCMTNADFEDEVSHPQSFSTQYLFFGATSFAQTNVVSPMTPFTLLAGHSYQLQLTSQEPDSSAYGIKGSPAASAFNFTTDPTCGGTQSCDPTTILPSDFLNGTVTPTDTTTPEPSTVALVIGGLLLIGGRRLR
jgi:hypothetical protein